MNKMRMIIFFLIFLVGCSPSPEAMEEALSLTLTALPTDTSNPTNTLSPTETLTHTPTILPTETPTLTPTPALRVLYVSPIEFFLENTDFSEITQYGSWGVETYDNQWIIDNIRNFSNEGKIYLEETGRVDGRGITYDRKITQYVLPRMICERVIIFRTIEGAQLAMDRAKEFSGDTISPPIGDITKSWNSKSLQTSGRYTVDYWLTFTYRNYLIILDAHGWEGEVDDNLMEKMALAVLKKLEESPLSDYTSIP